MKNHVANCKIIQYADDTFLLASNINPETCCQDLEKDLKTLTSFFSIS